MAPDGQFMEAAFNFYSDRFKIESQLSAVLMRWYEGGIRALLAVSYTHLTLPTKA